MMRLSLLFLALSTAAPVRAEVSRFALAIGSNRTLNAKLAPLRFADDDAARVAELLSEAGVDVTLVTTFDRQSQQVFWDLIERVTPATSSGLESAYEALVGRMQGAKQRGATVDLLIYYSGHGDVGPDGNGYLTLDGGKLTRQDLFKGLLGRSPADINHLVIDACRSEQFVLSRGGSWQPDRAAHDYTRDVRRYLDEQTLEHFTNTGVILATSADQQTHEWERYRGGVFTHQLLSGLRGAADVNGDGAIEYSEIGAFVAAANSGVTVPRARLRVVLLPPKSSERHPVVEHDDIGAQRVLLFPSHARGHYSLEDERGVRLADLNRAGGSPTYVRLPDGQLYLYRQGQAGGSEQEVEIPGEEPGPIMLAALEFSDSSRRPRGAINEAFRDGLFRVAYGPGYYAGYTDRSHLLAVREPQWEVQVWRRIDDELAEVKRITGDSAETDPDQESLESVCDEIVEEIEKAKSHERYAVHWRAISLGAELAAIPPAPALDSDRLERVGQDDRPAGFSGLDVRWRSFRVGPGGRFPSSDFFFRTGYTRGEWRITSPASGYAQGEATGLTYQTVPLYFGGNWYWFEEFFVRPFVGGGAGMDVIMLDYSRHEHESRTTLGTLLGAELHAGVDLRLSNYVILQAEVRRLWSRSRDFKALPDFDTDSTTFTLGIGLALPLDNSPKATRHRRKRRKKARSSERQVQPPAWPVPAPPAAPAPPLPEPPPPAAAEPPPADAPMPDDESPGTEGLHRRRKALEKALEAEEQRRQAE